jgi:hypothetical protein
MRPGLRAARHTDVALPIDEELPIDGVPDILLGSLDGHLMHTPQPLFKPRRSATSDGLSYPVILPGEDTEVQQKPSKP